MFWVMMYMLFFSGSAAPELLIPDEEVLRKAIKDEQRLENVLAIGTVPTNAEVVGRIIDDGEEDTVIAPKKNFLHNTKQIVISSGLFLKNLTRHALRLSHYGWISAFT